MSSTDQTSGAQAPFDPKPSSRGKTWLVIGKMRYGTKATDDYMNRQAAFILAHPELYSLHTMDKRLKWEDYDHKHVIQTADIVRALPVSMRQAQRLLQIARTKLRKNKNDYVTVAEFCRLNNLNEKETKMRMVTGERGRREELDDEW